jgi:hypothetical protein
MQIRMASMRVVREMNGTGVEGKWVADSMACSRPGGGLLNAFNTGKDIAILGWECQQKERGFEKRGPSTPYLLPFGKQILRSG